LRIFRVRKEKVARDYEKRRNDDRVILHSSPHIIKEIKPRVIRWTEHSTSTEKFRNAYTVSVQKHERKRPLGRKE
jgi:hypothetical protein